MTMPIAWLRWLVTLRRHEPRRVALERALARSAQWRPEARLDAWVFGIVRNAWIDEVRARQRGQRLFAPEEHGAQVGESPFEGQDLAMSVQSALARLPEEQRILLVKFFDAVADTMILPVCLAFPIFPELVFRLVLTVFMM